MTINELMKVVHENAVAHGWWDDERRTEEVIALIHSEWSEALEEARAGRPLVWYKCTGASMAAYELHECAFFLPECCMEKEPCTWKESKPEGVAVELIDGCIRILDFMGKLDGNISERNGNETTIESLYNESNVEAVPAAAPVLIAQLHMFTSMTLIRATFGAPDMRQLLEAMAAAMSWVMKQGIDPLALLLEKHEYNKTRPYKHGKQF